MPPRKSWLLHAGPEAGGDAAPYFSRLPMAQGMHQHLPYPSGPSLLPSWQAEGLESPVATHSGGVWAFVSRGDLAKGTRRSKGLFSPTLRLPKLISVEPKQARARAPRKNSCPYASSSAAALAKLFRCLITLTI